MFFSDWNEKENIYVDFNVFINSLWFSLKGMKGCDCFTGENCRNFDKRQSIFI